MSASGHSASGHSASGHSASGQDDAARAQLPRDSATLIIVDTTGSEPRVLMGKRRMDQIFMPGKYVFPGGRVDSVDGTIEAAEELRPGDAAKMLLEMSGPASAARARAIALAAIRETFEEAGLLVGIRGTPRRPIEAAAWHGYFHQGCIPKLSQLTYFARAETPPGRPRRYDSRFFYADVSAIAHRSDTVDGELSSLDWFTFDQMRELDLPAITRVVLEDLIDRLTLDRSDPAASATAAVPFYRHRDGASRRHLLTL